MFISLKNAYCQAYGCKIRVCTKSGREFEALEPRLRFVSEQSFSE